MVHTGLDGTILLFLPSISLSLSLLLCSISFPLTANKTHQYLYFAPLMRQPDQLQSENSHACNIRFIWYLINCEYQIANTHTHKQTTNVMEIFSKLIDIWVHYTGRNFTWPRSLIKCLGIVGTQTGNNSSYRIRTDQLKWYDIMCTLTHNRVCINFTKFDSASACYIFFYMYMKYAQYFREWEWDVGRVLYLRRENTSEHNNC